MRWPRAFPCPVIWRLQPPESAESLPKRPHAGAATTGLVRPPHGIDATGCLSGATQASQFVENAIESGSLDVLHDEVGVLVLPADAEHRHDVGMVQPRRRLGLAFKPTNLVRGVRDAAPGRIFNATRRLSFSSVAS